LHLVSKVKDSRWAYHDNSMIFGPDVVLVERHDANLYHLIDLNKNEIEIDVDNCIIEK
jgi:hypothetical protein